MSEEEWCQEKAEEEEYYASLRQLASHENEKPFFVTIN